jgi:hypothetical protein
LKRRQVRVKGHDMRRGFGQSREIAADTAAKVCHHGEAGETARAMGGGKVRRCLFQAGPSEQHLPGSAELLARRYPQGLLGKRRRDQAGRIMGPELLAQSQGHFRGYLVPGKLGE